MTVHARLPQRRIGDREVGCIGLGCMPMSFPLMLDDRPRALATIHAALDAGVTLLDTANIYAPAWNAMGHNEELVAEALRTWDGEAADRSALVVATKGGITRGPGETWGRDGSPDGLLRAAEESLRVLGVDVIDLYQHHRADPAIPYAQQVAALGALRDRGLVRQVGLSNVNLPELDLALELLGGTGGGGVVSVQNEFSPRYRGDADVLDRCTELGIAFLPWSPLGGADQAAEVGSRYEAFGRVAADHGVSPQRVVLAWLLALSPVVIPIPGSSRPESVLDSVAAAELVLSADEVAVLSTTPPAADSMYPDDQPRPPLR
ncbi:MAG: aldo/keto reductase [Candidatus Nanopelagicales bacterium]